MKTSARLRLTAWGTGLLALLLGGCAQHPAEVPPGIGLAPEQVVELPPATGSNIPRRVKVKEAVAADATKKSATLDVSGEEFRRSLRPGRQLETAK